MIEQQVPYQSCIYCKLIPQPFLNNNGRTFILELLPTQEIQYQQQFVINQYQKENIININPIQFNQNYINQNNERYISSLQTTKIIRKKVNLDQNAIRFKEKFYALFTYRKRIPKNLVFNIHNNIAKEINLRSVTREECRSVDKYFRNFSKYQKEIIGYLCKLTNEERIQLQSRSQENVNQIENDSEM